MVERVVQRIDGAAPFTVPTSCPACGGDVVVRSEREAEFLMCALPSQCQQARISSLEHFAKVTDIQGFGPKVIEQCVERALLGEPADFFTLKHEQLRTLERLGDKSAHNLVEAIAARDRLDLDLGADAEQVARLGRSDLQPAVVVAALIHQQARFFGGQRREHVEVTVAVEVNAVRVPVT